MSKTNIWAETLTKLNYVRTPREIKVHFKRCNVIEFVEIIGL